MEVFKVQKYFVEFETSKYKKVFKSERKFKCYQSFSQGVKYTGFIGKDSTREGIGMQIWPDGSYYVGEWSDNKFNGIGVFNHKNGDKYEG